MFPTFLVVGAAKAGTTSLYHYLAAHPEIYMSPVKEPFFFSFVDIRPHFMGPHDQATNESIICDLDEYRALFAGMRNEKAAGECSNSYLYFPWTAENIRKHIPNCKIIIVLREPVARAYSHYLQACMLGHEDQSFEEALQKQAERERLNWRWHYQYVKQGLYHEQVKRYLDTFGKERVRIHLFEDFTRNTQKVMQDIYTFLGVEPAFVPPTQKVHNRTGVPTNLLLHKLFRHPNPVKKLARLIFPQKVRAAIHDVIKKVIYDYSKGEGISKETRKHLLDVFREDVEKLQSLIGQDLSNWLTTP